MQFTPLTPYTYKYTTPCGICQASGFRYLHSNSFHRKGYLPTIIVTHGVLPKYYAVYTYLTAHQPPPFQAHSTFHCLLKHYLQSLHSIPCFLCEFTNKPVRKFQELHGTFRNVVTYLVLLLTIQVLRSNASFHVLSIPFLYILYRQLLPYSLFLLLLS